MTEDVATILAILGGIATAAAAIITSVKKVGEGNYSTLKIRLAQVEKNQRRQNIVIGFLTEWQLVGRELIRLMGGEIVNAGSEFTPQMQELQRRLNKELTLEDLLADDEPEEAGSRRGRHRGSV